MPQYCPVGSRDGCLSTAMLVVGMGASVLPIGGRDGCLCTVLLVVGVGASVLSYWW